MIASPFYHKLHPQLPGDAQDHAGKLFQLYAGHWRSARGA
jgi:hypothetical protein